MLAWLRQRRMRVLAYALIIVAGLAFSLWAGPPWTGPLFIAAWVVADVAWHRLRVRQRSEPGTS